MACWQDELVQMLRVRINDLTASPTYTDKTLQLVLCVAARDVVTEIDFDNDYTINVSVPSISPDPVATNDYDFANLVTLRAACTLGRGLQKSKGMQAMSIKDGPANIDGREIGRAMATWADSLCAEYTEASLQYRLGSRLAGHAIVGPYTWDDSTNASGFSNRNYDRNGDSSYFN